MGLFDKSKVNKGQSGPQDPLGLDEAPQGKRTALSEPEKGARQERGTLLRPLDGRLSRRERRKVARVEQIKKAIEDSGEKIDTDAVVSLYLPQRRARRFGAALLRLNKLYLLLLSMLLALAILFIMSFTQEKMGNFTINLNRLEMYRKGISIAETGDFADATARLVADAVVDATNISVYDLPDDLDDAEGNHNGKNYMAYTYYVRNASKEDVSYAARVNLDSCAKGAENAVRVAVWRNGERTIYAEPSADGTPETGCTNFSSHKTVCTYVEDEFLVGNVDKYTIVIWMEGDDPDCVDNIVGGSVQFSMTIDADDEDDTSLFVKFVRDIADTLTGNKPIFGSSDSDAPNYYWDNEITWENRRNQ